MYQILIAGVGKIGSLIGYLLLNASSYKVHLLDVNFDGHDAQKLIKSFPDLLKITLDVRVEQEVINYMKLNHIDAVISSLPYFLNIHIANAAIQAGVHYFDLTEDTSASQQIRTLAAGISTAVVPQCGLAPGFISIVTHHLIQAMDSCFQAKMRVGALPQCTSNPLHYSLTWSTDGLINEYGNSCYGLHDGKLTLFNPLEGLESIQIQGISYEAFHTSGGIGHLAERYQGRVQRLSYKTIRYPGHCDKMRFLMDTLKLNEDRETLKRILERAMPKTYQDVVVIYVSVEGIIADVFMEQCYVKKIMPMVLNGYHWSAIQYATASSVCAVLEMVLQEPKQYTQRQ